MAQISVAAPAACPTRRPRALRFTRSEAYRLSGLLGVVALLHVVGWGAFAYYTATHPHLGVFAGAGVLAYTFGLRHAFDPDHIAAIDDTTRFMLAKGRQPLGIGLFFSLGHSTVVLALTGVVAFAAGKLSTHAVASAHSVGAVIGASVSGSFLYLVGALNLVILLGIARTWRAMKTGCYRRQELEDLLLQRGLMNRIFGGRYRTLIDKSWHMYPVGFLFGLGFDTASEIGLLAIAGKAAADGGLPPVALLSLPVIFAAGMALMDTLDGAFMCKAYDWAFTNPLRRVYYNLTTTGLSVAVALLIGTVELVGVLAHEFSLHGQPWAAVSAVSNRFDVLGYVIVGMFVAAWALSVAYWRVRGIERRYGHMVTE